MSNIAIITARGGSKRIPRKNIKEFCGKPIICYSIEAALESGVFDTVMVSTDDEKIAQIAKEAGAEVPFFRSEATSNDYAGTADVLKEVIDTYADMGQTFDYGCCIYPTAPFVTGQKLKDAMEKLICNLIDREFCGRTEIAFIMQSKIGTLQLHVFDIKCQIWVQHTGSKMLQYFKLCN